MDVPLSTQAYDRSLTGGALEILRNMYSEPQSSTDGRSHTLKSRAGLKPFAAGYSGATRAMEANEGLFGGDLFTVNGGALHRTTKDGITTILGDVEGDGLVTIAASRTEVMVCVAPNLYSYNGTDLVAVDMAGRDCSSIAYLGQRFIGAAADSDRFYWSDLLDGRTWDGLNFATAEGRSDEIVRIYTTSQYVVLFGTESIEVYGLSANPRTESDAFYRVSTGAMPHGLFAPLSVAQEDSFVFWLSDRRTIYVAAGLRPSKISTPYVQNRLDALTDDELKVAHAYSYTQDGHTFYVFTVSGKFTLAYDLGTQKWQEWDTLGLGSWQAMIGTQAFDKIIVGNDQEDSLYELDLTAVRDNETEIVQDFSVSLAVREPFVVSDVTIDMWSDTYGQMFKRFTEDGGRTWSTWDGANVTAPSYEDNQVMWRRFGTARAPERIMQFRFSTGGNLVIRGARLNDGVN